MLFFVVVFLFLIFKKYQLPEGETREKLQATKCYSGATDGGSLSVFWFSFDQVDHLTIGK